MMSISIRKFLLVNLLLAITITTTLTAIGNYYLDREDIKNHLDTLLSQAGFSLQALIADDIKHRNLNKIQEGLNAIPTKGQDYFAQYHGNRGYENKYQFQIWDRKKHLLLHSANAPKQPLYNKELGFSDQHIDNQDWRVFSTIEEHKGLYFIVAERYDSRSELAHRIAQDDIYIMLLTYPLSGFLIWFIIGQGLSSIQRIAKEVAHRAHNYLEPVSFLIIPIEIKPLIDELNKLFSRLQEAFEREKRFAADAAHELRTPLAAIKTQAQVALKTLDFTEQQALLQNVITGVDRSAHVVQQLLTLSRLLPEVTTIEDRDEVDLEKLTTEVIAGLVPLALDKQIDISLEVKNKYTSVLGNATALSILIRNLVDNAIRYTPDSGTVHIVIDRNKEKKLIILSVIDDGPGVPPELRTRIFERFYRILGNQSTGSGLGLAIVQQIAKLHSAEITLEDPKDHTGLQINIFFKEFKEN